MFERCQVAAGGGTKRDEEKTIIDCVITKRDLFAVAFISDSHQLVFSSLCVIEYQSAGSPEAGGNVGLQLGRWRNLMRSGGK